MLVDSFFFQKYTNRLILMHKLGSVLNHHSIPQLIKIVCFFIFSKIEDIHRVELYNCLYLFKFFFGRRAFLTKYKSFFSLGNWTYSIMVSFVVREKELYSFLYFFLNDFLSSIERSFLSAGLVSADKKIFYIVLRDMNVFSERKTNLGLFFLKSPLNVNLFCTGLDLLSAQILLKNLKFNLF